jgi:CRP-like cAMP-binding protein
MTATSVTTDLLRRFTPLDSLRRENLAALAKKIEVRNLESGKTLLREGDVDKRTYYLVSGTLELVDRSGASRLLRATRAGSRCGPWMRWSTSPSTPTSST